MNKIDIIDDTLKKRNFIYETEKTIEIKSEFVSESEKKYKSSDVICVESNLKKKIKEIWKPPKKHLTMKELNKLNIENVKEIILKNQISSESINQSIDDFGKDFDNDIYENYLNNKIFDKEDYILKFGNALKSSACCLEGILHQNEENNMSVKDDKFIKKYSVYNDIDLNGNLLHVLIEITKHFEMELSTFILMNIYLDRFVEKNNFFLSWRNIYILIICASIVALKINEDEIYRLTYYSKVSGIDFEILYKAENSFLKHSNYNFSVTRKDFMKYFKIMIMN